MDSDIVHVYTCSNQQNYRMECSANPVLCDILSFVTPVVNLYHIDQPQHSDRHYHTQHNQVRKTMFLSPITGSEWVWLVCKGMPT